MKKATIEQHEDNKHAKRKKTVNKVKGFSPEQICNTIGFCGQGYRCGCLPDGHCAVGGVDDCCSGKILKHAPTCKSADDVKCVVDPERTIFDTCAPTSAPTTQSPTATPTTLSPTSAAPRLSLARKKS